MNTNYKLFGISMQEIILLALLGIFSGAVFFNIDNKILNGITTAVVGWYFGQRNKNL